MNPLAPIDVYICGLFDGSHLWIQWDDRNPEAGYHVQIRLRENEHATWEEWRPIQEKNTKRKTWACLSVHRPGWLVEARVCSALEGAPWWLAQEVTFLKCVAEFEFLSQRGDQFFLSGREFHCFVDGANVHYRLREDLHLKQGEAARAWMTSTFAVGWSQLDEADQFLSYLPGGLRVRNIGPSSEDISLTGRSFTKLQAASRGGAVKVVFRKRIA